ncbi:hypothetical protein AXK12_07995 [Cephaloticoccus capnophilus]|uniref:TonB C-terminal domain-containing protein n=1 Tax=Cephaloticoccus capnophilus TaxID=1548208 RepID=A0A139SHW0_9BACT|nr:energy transducer TonB [Cephaloticoccus capnophilus]KXU34111.1 hypothetical protein AXK12_07995 [Cephaloticoccus capnophilus]
MQENRPKAFFLSLGLHAALGAAIVFFSYTVRARVKPQPHLFELVAGPGENYAALEAPLGDDSAPAETAIRFELPEPPPSPVREPEPPAPPPVLETAPEVSPIELAPEAPNPESPKPAPPPRRNDNATPKPAPPKPEPKPMTKAEFDRLHGNKPNPTAVKPTANRPAPPVRQISTRGIVGGSPSVSEGAGGTALSRAESDLLEAYIALLRQRLRAAHTKPAGLSDLLQAKVRFAIAADGTLSNLRIVTSSGSREFDDSVLAAFRKVRSIGPTPNGKADTWELTFKLRDGS